MTTNGQLNDTCGYHTKPTNSTCNMIFCFRLKANIFFVSAVKLLSMEIILIIIETKMYAKIRVALGVCFSIYSIWIHVESPKYKINDLSKITKIKWIC